MDLNMPEMDGFEATKRIRAKEVKSGLRIPIVALTAIIKPETQVQCLDSGMDAVLYKPFKMVDLIDVITDLTDPVQG